MFRRLIVALALIVFAQTLSGMAHATGGVWCDVDDPDLGLRFKAVSSRDGTGGWFGIEGHVETRFGTLPAHLKRFKITDGTLTERWWGPEGVLLVIQKYVEDPFAAVRLTVVAKPADEGSYEGTWALRMTAGRGDGAYVTRQGKVSCGSD